jgi:hypothetical protein
MLAGIVPDLPIQMAHLKLSLLIAAQVHIDLGELFYLRYKLLRLDKYCL